MQDESISVIERSPSQFPQIRCFMTSLLMIYTRLSADFQGTQPDFVIPILTPTAPCLGGPLKYFFRRLDGKNERFGSGIQHFQDVKAGPEISSRYLSPGRDQVWGRAQIWRKNWDGVGSVTLPTRAGLRSRAKFLRFFCEHQKIDTGLKFLVAESVCEINPLKSKKQRFLDQSLEKNIWEVR